MSDISILLRCSIILRRGPTSERIIRIASKHSDARMIYWADDVASVVEVALVEFASEPRLENRAGEWSARSERMMRADVPDGLRYVAARGARGNIIPLLCTATA
jgi:hypothetical protein